jgi:predicted MFS family arabinose efflux permease
MQKAGHKESAFGDQWWREWRGQLLSSPVVSTFPPELGGFPPTDQAPPPEPRFGLLEPLRCPNFRLLWIGESVSVVGSQFHMVALPWLTLQMTGSGLALGTVLMAGAIPRALLLLAGGVFADRFTPRTMMVVSNMVRAVIVAVLTLLVWTESITLPQIYGLAVLFGIFDAFFYPAFTSIVPTLVSKEQLAAGNALVHGTTQLGTMLGPAIAGVAIAQVGVTIGFGAHAVSLLFAGLVLMMIRSPGPVGGTGKGVLHEIAEGLRFVWHDPLLRILLAISASLNLAFIGPFLVGASALAFRRFGGPTSLGIMLSAIGGGALLGMIIGGSSKQLPRHRTLILSILLVVGAGLAMLAVVPTVWWAAAVIAPIGIAAGIGNVVVLTDLQHRTPPEMLGRVMSLVMLTAIGLTPISYAAAGALADISLETLFFSATAAVLLTLAFATGNRALRKFE